MQNTIMWKVVGAFMMTVTGIVSADSLQPDPAWQEGKLENGFSWQVLATPQRPNDPIELRLMVGSGSMLEGAQQAGFSYLLPQIAMKRNVAPLPAQLQNFWQQVNQIPASMPPVVNSYGFTLYSISIPNNRSDLLKESLAWLSDSMGKLPIDAESISEVLRNPQPIVTFPANITDTWWRYRLKDSALLGHDPAPPSSHVDSAALKEFYQQNYTPDVMTLYVVGNVDIRSLTEQIGKQFSNLQGKRQAPAPLPSLQPLSVEPVNLLGEQGSPNVLSLVWDRAWTPIRDDKALLHYWLSDLARESLFLRLQQVAKDKKNNVQLGFNCTAQFQRAYCAMHINTTQDSLKSALTTIANALEELEEKGLTPEEFNLLQSQKKQQLDQLFAAYAKMDTGVLMSQRILSQQNNIVDIAPENYQLRRQAFLSSLTLEVLNQEIRSYITQPPVLILTQPAGEQEQDIKELNALYQSIVKSLVVLEEKEANSAEKKM